MNKTNGKTDDARAAEMAALYFDENLTQAEIAKRYGITPQTVSKHLNKEYILDEYDKRRKAQTLRAKIKLAAATERAVEVQRAYLDMDLPINLEYLRQNAARDILDRSGVKTEAVNEDNNVVITFANPWEIGMPSSDVVEEEVEDPSN